MTRSLFGLAPAAVLSAMALVAGVQLTGGSSPELSLHLDTPAPDVVLGTPPSTASLRADVAADDFRGAAAPGEPGLPGLSRHVAPSCTGNGEDGNRVKVIYAVEAGRPDRYNKLLPEIRSWVADVDDTFAVSADRNGGGGTRVRWVHKDCVPVIDHQVLPAGSLKSGFSATVSALEAAGYTRGDRKYLVFADDADLCGIAQLYRDTSRQDNANDGGNAMFARVDSPCWVFQEGWHSVPAHEVMHMLGGVQDDSPNSTEAGHCSDETDVMCYDDGGPAATIRSVCDGSEYLFDCGGDDYFTTAPRAGTYLATHWNAADSSFLDRVGALKRGPAVKLTGPGSVRAGLAATYRATSPSAGATFRWSASPSDCLPGDRSGAKVRLQCPSWRTGKVTLTVSAATSGSTTTLATRTVTLPRSPKAAFSVKVRAAKKAVSAGARTSVTVRLAHDGAPVRGTVTLYARTGSGGWHAVSKRRDTGSDGVRAFTVHPRRDTQYTAAVTYAPNGGWREPTGTKARLRVT